MLVVYGIAHESAEPSSKTAKFILSAATAPQTRLDIAIGHYPATLGCKDSLAMQMDRLGALDAWALPAPSPADPGEGSWTGWHVPIGPASTTSGRSRSVSPSACAQCHRVHGRIACTGMGSVDDTAGAAEPPHVFCRVCVPRTPPVCGRCAWSASAHGCGRSARERCHLLPIPS